MAFFRSQKTVWIFIAVFSNSGVSLDTKSDKSGQYHNTSGRKSRRIVMLSSTGTLEVNTQKKLLCVSCFPRNIPSSCLCPPVQRSVTEVNSTWSEQQTSFQYIIYC